jgi:hypothetical protein
MIVYKNNNLYYCTDNTCARFHINAYEQIQKNKREKKQNHYSDI